MTLEQCLKLKDMGFDKKTKMCFIFWDSYRGEEIEEEITIKALNAFDEDEILYSPTAEEALEWVSKKLNNKIEGLFTENKYLLAYYVNSEINFKTDKKTLSDAVYALIVWAYENKLLEGK